MAEAYFKSVWPQNERGPFGQDPLKGYVWEGASMGKFSEGRGWDERVQDPDCRTKVYRVDGTPAQLAAIAARVGPAITAAEAHRLRAPQAQQFLRRLMAHLGGGSPPNWAILNDLLAKVPLFWACWAMENYDGAGALLVLARDRGVISQATYDAIKTLALEESVPLSLG